AVHRAHRAEDACRAGRHALQNSRSCVDRHRGRCDPAAVTFIRGISEGEPMNFDFDTIVDRRGTDSNKWHKFGPDVLPLWVADMDFASPAVVVEALRARVEHGIYGYLRETPPDLLEVFTERCRKRYGWNVPHDAVMLLPGVNPANNVAARTVCGPGDGIVVFTPAYPPMLRVPDNCGLDARLPLLARRARGPY